MTVAPDRAFKLYARGELREEFLADFRVGLRQMTNPATGTAFSETEIATATAEGSRWFAEADALDLVLLAAQANGLWFADQVRIDRSGTSWLTGYHGDMWGETKLPATGGSGPATATGNVGTIYVGSTTVPDPIATYATDPAGLKYQVLQTAQVQPGETTVAVTLVAIDTGSPTNIDSGTILTWANGPLGSQPTATTTAKFTGGTPEETDADFAKRLGDRIKHKPASGNNAHFRAWGRDSSNAVLDCYVYSCAHHAGSVHCAILQKRSGVAGPAARIPSAGTLTAATAYLVPPASPAVPSRAHVVVTGATSEPVNLAVELAMPKGNDSGWQDPKPFPGYSTTVSTVTAVADSTHFTMHSDTALPAAVTAPKMMVWVLSTSRFVALDVLSVTSLGGGSFAVVLNTAQALTAGDYLSPYTARLTLIAETIEEYFDSLGPGEVIDLDTDVRGHRAFRFPEPAEEAPYRAGLAAASRLSDALGSSAADAALPVISQSTPSLPAEVVDGPRLLTLGKFAVISF